MKKILLICGLFVLLISCKPSGMITYDPRMKTDKMLHDEIRSGDGPWVLVITFENSLKNDHIKVGAMGLEDRGRWYTYFDGVLNNCTAKACYSVKVNSTYEIHITLNDNEKIVIENTSEHPLSTYNNLIVSKLKGKYKLSFTNYL